MWSKLVSDMNIERYERLLKRETDPVRRATLETLLAEERAKAAQSQLHPPPRPG